MQETKTYEITYQEMFESLFVKHTIDPERVAKVINEYILSKYNTETLRAGFNGVRFNWLDLVRGLIKEYLYRIDISDVSPFNLADLAVWLVNPAQIPNPEDSSMISATLSVLAENNFASADWNGHSNSILYSLNIDATAFADTKGVVCIPREMSGKLRVIEGIEQYPKLVSFVNFLEIAENHMRITIYEKIKNLITINKESFPHEKFFLSSLHELCLFFFYYTGGSEKDLNEDTTNIQAAIAQLELRKKPVEIKGDRHTWKIACETINEQISLIENNSKV